jgi:hypothetical protein
VRYQAALRPDVFSLTKQAETNTMKKKEKQEAFPP